MGDWLATKLNADALKINDDGKARGDAITNTPHPTGGHATGSISEGAVSAEIAHDGAEIVTRSHSTQTGTTDHLFRHSGFDRVEDKNGNPVAPQDMNDDTIVDVPGYGKMELRYAKANGWLPKSFPGAVDAPQDQPQRDEKDGEDEDQEQHPDLKAEAFADEGAEAALSDLINSTASGTQLEAAAQIAETGEISERTVNELATQMGVEPDVAREKMDGVTASFVDQAVQTVSDVVPDGIDPEAVLLWFGKERGADAQQAMFDHATKRTTHAYAKAADHYMANLAHINPEWIEVQDFGGFYVPRRNPKTGEMGIGVEGQPEMWMSWEVLWRSGAIKKA